MPRKSKNTVTPVIEENIQRRISAMGDSVWLIQQMIHQNRHSEEVHRIVNQNIQHLELMLNKDEIKNSGADLTSFNIAILEGKAFITE